MASVTQRINEIQQPYGGYLPMKLFAKEQIIDGVTLNETENIHPGLVGLAVDYLTRFMSGSTVDQAFHISTLGASLIFMADTATELKSQITGLDAKSITAACKLSGFDVCLRASPLRYKPVEEISPDKATIENIRTMVNRSLRFWEKHGPILCSEPTFEGGYTNTVNAGDGDYVTRDTLWDFKVSKSAPNSKQTLQILMYYIMGLHSTHEYYKDIKQLGFYNPRMNMVYTCSVANISPDTIKAVEEQVICYGETSPRSPSHTQRPTTAPNKTAKPKTAQRKTIERTTIQSTIAPHTEATIVEYTVMDICSMTGRDKNTVYEDIRSGKLIAHKKGNKYVISRDEYERYQQNLEDQREAMLAVFCALGVIAIIVLLFAVCVSALGSLFPLLR